MRNNRILQLIAVAALATALAATSARADTSSFDVQVETSALAGVQTILFGITDGDGVADNSVSLSNFNFASGSALGSASVTGSGITGNLTSGITLNDSGFSALFEQQFTSGASLSFLLTTTNAFAGLAPDAFAMYLCSGDLSACYSDDTSTGAVLVLNLTGAPLTPASFILNGASDQDLPAPLVSVPTTGGQSVPEPPALVLIICGLLGIVLAAGWRGARKTVLAG
ncbi:MAG: hypothetical protein ABSG69_08660 [Candidatus Acidiferrum sp.]